jgi:hypothetical protein
MSFIFSGFRAFLLLVMIHAVFKNILLTGTDMAGTQRCCIANILLISIYTCTFNLHRDKILIYISCQEKICPIIHNTKIDMLGHLPIIILRNVIFKWRNL